jgi:hypothetical protein
VGRCLWGSASRRGLAQAIQSVAIHLLTLHGAITRRARHAPPRIRIALRHKAGPICAQLGFRPPGRRFNSSRGPHGVRTSFRLSCDGVPCRRCTLSYLDAPNLPDHRHLPSYVYLLIHVGNSDFQNDQNDGDDDEKLDERKAPVAAGRSHTNIQDVSLQENVQDCERETRMRAAIATTCQATMRLS